MTGSPNQVEFYFDPMCPWAYQASKWIRSVRASEGIDIRWRFFSLEEINREDGKKHPWEREWSFGWSQMRIGALLRRMSQEDVDRWYEAVGRAFFEDGRPTQHPEAQEEILVDLGFPPDTVARALADPTTHDEVRADHDHAVSDLGAFGVPTLAFPDGVSVFGPVVVPAPEGRQAVQLWEHVQDFRAFPTLYELKRTKTSEALTEIAARFEPYLRARTWRTIENPAP